MSRLLLLLSLLSALFTFAINAQDKSPSIFYPLPTLSQGKVFIAQDLFLGDEGGIWIHDVHGRVVFYDGQNVLPRRGSLLAGNPQQLAYAQNAFWTFMDNELYRTVPPGEPELVFSLTPGITIEKIGASAGYIWLTDETHFYTYHIATGEFQTYSLMTLFQLNQASKVVVNDAQMIYTKWVLATNAGVYLSNGQSFSHVQRSGKDYVETMFMSRRRDQLVVGTDDGALLIDINHPEQEPQKVGNAPVFSIVETENEYWIGTDNGLLVHSVETGNTVKLEGNNADDYGLSSGRIYSLVNDKQGGIWIATDKGIRYFSRFSQKFTRVLNRDIDAPSLETEIKHLFSINQGRQFLMSRSDGLYLIHFLKGFRKQRIYPDSVNDLVQTAEQLWLATNQGLYSYILNRPEGAVAVNSNDLLRKPIQHLELDSNSILWGSSDSSLWSLNLKSGAVTDYGSDWMSAAAKTSKVTALKATKSSGLLIGTDHGIYTLANQQISYDKASAAYGANIDIEESASGEMWFISTYGAFRRHFLHPETGIEPLPLIDDNIRLKCILKTSEGMWLGSSKGITLYDPNGAIKKHFGTPYGLVSNELRTGVCTSGRSSVSETLLFSSTLGLVKASAKELAESTLPPSPLIFSQISVDYRPLRVGSRNAEQIALTYGSPVSFQFGALPEARSQMLEFRLNNEQWQPLEGTQLALDQLMPGEYLLSIRSANAYLMPPQSDSLSFTVLKPWYLSNLAITIYAVGFIAIVILFSWWRSRIISSMNRELKEQVVLKTNQMRHQSKAVLSNNQQLRKQIQVRHLWLEKLLRGMKPSLMALIRQAQSGQAQELKQTAETLLADFEQLHVLGKDDHPQLAQHDMLDVIDTVLAGWVAEFAAAGIKVERHCTEALPAAALKHWGVDIIFNTLFAHAIKRLYRNQTLTIQCRVREQRIVIALIDCGDAGADLSSLMVASGDNQTASLNQLVAVSGGELVVFSSSERNLVELSWPQACDEEQTDQSALGAVTSSDSEDKQWLAKVDMLIAKHYADAEFSTSEAAKQLFVSERSLQRRFKTVTDKTFKEYLTEYRLERACQFLLEGAKVSQVAFDCGFNDPSYFSQRFKHHFGLSPTQFIEDKELV
ncbi:helix-turn-helix domain-containing protein [Vibrio fluvialis]|nr:helix-turn-helix domain-containing protein [Vibrio fluvialis]